MSDQVSEAEQNCAIYCWHELLLKGQKHADTLNSVVALVILANTIVIAMEADNPKENWAFIENVFLGFFVAELTIRLIVDGPHNFFCGADKGDDGESGGLRPGSRDGSDSRTWNLFDFAVVLFGVLDQWVLKFFRPDGTRGSMGQLLTMFRVVRILRILRMVRLFRMFPQLFMLASGLLESVKTVVWITVLFGMIICVFSIVTTNFVRENPNQEVQVYFGTVEKSMVTLFQFVTLDDWSRIARLVSGFDSTGEETNTPIMIFFIVYVLITAFSILSLLTGVISEHMINLTRYWQDKMANEEKEKTKKFIEWFQDWFEKADADNSQTISRDEFRMLLLPGSPITEKLEELEKEGFEIPEIRENAMADELFDSLCPSSGEEVTLADFSQGFLRMRGEAKGIHLLEVQSELRRIRNDLGLGGPQATLLGSLHVKLNTTMRLLEDVQENVRSLEHKVARLHRDHEHASHHPQRESTAPASLFPSLRQ